MPDAYGPDDFDLAGFAVGIAEKDAILPRKEEIRRGDVILGLPSSGIHSNGLSLARKVIPETDREGWEDLLVPTRIYAKEMAVLTGTRRVLAAAHITGGGLVGNLTRVMPAGLSPSFSFDWEEPPVFKRIRGAGVSEDEMRKVFNLGIGVALIAHDITGKSSRRRPDGKRFQLQVIGTIE